MDTIAVAALIESFFLVVGIFVGAMAALSVAKYIMMRNGMCVPGMSCK